MTFETVRNILIEQLNSVPETITPASRIREDLGADSLDFVELIMAFEDEMDIDIPDEQAEKILTVQDIVNLAS